jgi:hypothetical protein
MRISHRYQQGVREVIVELELDRAVVGVARCVSLERALEDVVGQGRAASRGSVTRVGDFEV